MELMICPGRKSLSTRRGDAFWNRLKTSTISTNPMVMPRSGETTIAESVSTHLRPHTSAAKPPRASAAPAKPPMRAWDDDDGMPKNHVMRFHAMAPISAAAITLGVTIAGTTKPLLPGLATAGPTRVTAAKLPSGGHTTGGNGGRRGG